MAENNNSENFALGLIVAALVYLIFRKQVENFLDKRGIGNGNRQGATAISNGASGGGCGCSSPCSGKNKPGPSLLPSNPEVSLGGESYSEWSFGSSSVRS